MLLLIGLANAEVQTLADMGIDAVVGPVKKSGTWEIPYQFEGNCTPFFSVKLVSGQLVVIDNNEIVLKTKRPGRYRVLLNREGLLKITLSKLEGDERAEIDGGSFIACDRVPVIELNRISPDVWKVGGYTTVQITLRNAGTADAEGILILKNPYNAAPRDPLKKLRVPAGKTVEYNITMLTAKEDTKVLFPKLCFEYSDKYGQSIACTDSTTFRAEKNVPLACISRDGKIEAFNIGYLPTESMGKELLPRDSHLLESKGASQVQNCVIAVKIQKVPFKEIGDEPVYYALILTLLGIIGITVSEKRLKTSKA